MRVSIKIDRSDESPPWPVHLPLPRVGDHISYPFADFVVTGVTWFPGDGESPELASVTVFLQDEVPEEESERGG